MLTAGERSISKTTPLRRLPDPVRILWGKLLTMNVIGLGLLNSAMLPSPEADQGGATRPRPTTRILLVDDEAQLRSLIGATLKHEGFDVLSVAGAHDAMEMLKQNGIDLVLTDIVMKDGNGIVLLEHIRAEQPQIPVVIVSAISDLGVAVDSMRRGACDYLLKPFRRGDLLATVQRALDRRQTLNELQIYQKNLENAVHARTEMLRQAIADIEYSYDVTLEALGVALDLKDAETEGHSKRVTAYTILLARAMGLTATQIKVIARGAFLHDMGKMAIPDAILRKPGLLTVEERDVVREHCVRGYSMLRNIPFLSESAEIVYSHQEQFDGNGYPRRLSGSEIPLGARIFAVADTLDAITSDRPYRKVRSFDEARAEIQRCSGTQLDPSVVEAFLKIPNELWHELRSEIISRDEQLSTLDIGCYPPSPQPSR
jgi:putative nucleotidyltransferase with HDIG domain